LLELEQAGLLQEGPSQNPAEDAYWSLLGVDPAGLDARRKASAVEVAAPDGGGAAMTIQAMQALGIPVSSPAHFRIVVVRDYLAECLRQMNQERLSSGAAWMLVRPFGRKQWIGPLFVPGTTPCWSCMAHALERNGWSEGACVASLATTGAVTQTLAAAEAAKWLLAGSNPTIQGIICEIDTADLSVTRHIVRRHSACPDCGGSAAVLVTPEALISPLTGIVTRVELAHSEQAFSLCVAEMSQLLRPDASGALFYTKRGVVTGKGRTPAQARLRCLGEAVERYCTQLHGDESRVSASWRELGARAVDPQNLLLFSDTQYRQGHRAPPRFDRNAAADWTPVRSLITGEERLVPTAYCYFGYGHAACGASSNGCAAGETLEDATFRGLLELIERDAVAIWWYNRVPRPELFPPNTPEIVSTLLDALQSRFAAVHLVDVSTDFDMPVCVAIGVQAGGARVLLGAGCAPDPAVSARRALEELAAHAVERGTPPGCALEAWMLPAPAAIPRQPGAATLEGCLERLRSLSLDALLLDLSRPETGMSAARVIVPGLRPWKPRFAPGRLYDVPVALGWRLSPLTEAELNPVSFPL
jgi:ribosomal protein S12 methylthiotransferase accessory factor